MAGSQFHNVSDVCSAMKEFSRATSQSTAKGSFATQDMLTTFSEALTCLCNEVVQLRAELDDFRTKTQRSEREATVPSPNSKLRRAAPKKSAKAVRRTR